MTHNKNQYPLLNLLINCVSAKYAPQMLSSKGKCTFCFSSFLINGLCNCDMIKRKLRVASYEFIVTSLKLKSTS